MTFELPPELKKRMERHAEVNWSEVFRQAIERHLEAARLAKELLDDIEDPRVQAIASTLKRRIGRRFVEDLRARRG